MTVKSNLRPVPAVTKGGNTMKKHVTRIIAAVLTFATIFSVFTAIALALPNFEDEYGDFLNKLGYYESRNTYNIKNSYGYMGRWQIGHLALQDIGFMTNSTTYSSLAHSYGVYSDQDFLNTPAAQDYCVQALHKKIWSYIKYYGDEKYIGKTMFNTTVTISGMIAAGHAVGVGGLHQMLTTGVAPDSSGSYYLKELGGYYISKSLGIAGNVPVKSVTISKTTLSLEAGSTYTLTATVSPNDATNKSVTWSSSNTAVATVSSGGKVTAVAAGKADITVKTVDGSYTAKCAVTVTAKPQPQPTQPQKDDSAESETFFGIVKETCQSFVDLIISIIKLVISIPLRIIPFRIK